MVRTLIFLWFGIGVLGMLVLDPFNTSLLWVVGSLTKALAQDFKLCVGCLGGNFFRKGIPRRFKNTVSSTKPLELVHSDVCG